MTAGGSDVPADSHLVRIFATASTPEGLLVKGLLESEGIPVFEKGEAEGPYRLGQVYLWVPGAFEVQARTLIEEAQASSLEIAEGDEIDVGMERTDL